MVDRMASEILVQDTWEAIPEKVREEFLAKRVASATWSAYGRQDSASRHWEPLRPVVLHESAYRHLESVAARLLHLAVESCRRRASTVGELHRLLRFRNNLPLMQPDRPLVASELTRYARPDMLLEQGRPQLLEFNNSTRLGGDTVTPRLARAFVEVCPEAGLGLPPSVVTARTAALIDTLAREFEPDNPPRLLIPAYWAMDDDGGRQHYDKIKKPVLDDLHRAGFEVVQAELSELRLDPAGRLLAGRTPIDIVLILWGSGEAARIVDERGGLEALRSADMAKTIQMFPRTESVLISSKVVLAWLHEDADAGVLDTADRDLVRAHIPWTMCLGLTEDVVALDPSSRAMRERHRLVAKPAGGKSGAGVQFGSHASEQDWLAATVEASREAPVVLQRRVEPDSIAMPFLDRDTGTQATADVPVVLSPFMVNGKAASVGVRHMSPDAPTQDVVISVSHGARSNTVVLTG